MSKRIDDTEAEQLLAGMTPAGRPELRDLADALGSVRTSALAVAAPQPNERLVARLEGQALAPISITGVADVATPSTAGTASHAVRRPAFIEGVRSMMEWISGVSLTSKIAIGMGVVVFGVTGVGAAGALPGPAQSAFDTIVSTVTGSEPEVDDDPAPFVDDESDVDDDPVRQEENEVEVDDDPESSTDDDEGEVDDDPVRHDDDDEAEVDDDPVRHDDDDEGEVDDDPVRDGDDDEGEVDDDPAPEGDDEPEVDDDPAPETEED
ncbi:hypothetical protein [Microcella sp.]|uniref:hypothetical protein n=1 Tax=Microcella sp. TaxID=1913979 RepID=UPI00391B104D